MIDIYCRRCLWYILYPIPAQFHHELISGRLFLSVLPFVFEFKKTFLSFFLAVLPFVFEFRKTFPPFLAPKKSL